MGCGNGRLPALLFDHSLLVVRLIQEKRPHAPYRPRLRAYRRGERLRRAGARQRTCGAGPRHHQSRHRPAGFPHARLIVEAAIKALRDGHHGYTPATGIPPLREAVAADLHKRFGVEVSPDEVMIVPGGKPTMFMAILMFGEPGADILYPDPGFPIYRSMIEFTGARPVPMPIREENGFAFSAEETLKLITPKTRLLILNSPANPTGGVTPKSRGRQARRRPRAMARRRDHVGRDLRPHGL